MKIRSIATPLALSAAMLVSPLGCKSKKPPPVSLPPSAGTGNRASDTDQAGKLSQTTGLDETTEKLRLGIPASQGHPGWHQNRETFSADTVHFDYDSTVIKAEAKPKVASVADYLKGNANTAVLIEGHCDERGTEEYNRSLGERRAIALREELVRLGINPERVDTVTFGRDRPVDTGNSEAAHSKNRRGEFVLLTPP